MPIPRKNPVTKKSVIEKVAPVVTEKEEEKIPARIAPSEEVNTISEEIEEERSDINEMITVANLSAEALATKKILDKRPKVMFMVPAAPGTEFQFETVQINGYKVTVQKGKMVCIPDRIAEVIANKYSIKLESEEQSLSNKTLDTQRALS